VWERAGRLQDACDGSYFNGLPLFTGGLGTREVLTRCDKKCQKKHVPYSKVFLFIIFDSNSTEH
jgi:hypothetical protein